jgi:hypothetical protein
MPWMTNERKDAPSPPPLSFESRRTNGTIGARPIGRPLDLALDLALALIRSTRPPNEVTQTNGRKQE